MIDNEQLEMRLAVINAMIRALGKVTNAEIRLTHAKPPQPDAAADLAARRKQLRAQIDELQGQVADQWTVSAAQLEERLRQANNRVQDYIRNIKNDVNVAGNVVKLIGQIDAALSFLGTVVAQVKPGASMQ